MRQWIFFIIMGCSVCACKQDIDLYEGNSSIYFDDNSAGVMIYHGQHMILM